MRFLASILAASFSLSAGCAPRSSHFGRNAFLVLVDGLRWQEVFSGADQALMNEDNGVKDVASLKAAFWRDSPADRRQALMPFFWNTIAKHGQLIGNQYLGSIARVSNGLKFSYPGYSEMLVGFHDPRIDSNRKVLNPNITVLEWLHRRPGFHGRIAAFAAWDVVPYILNHERCGFYINAGIDPVTVPPISREQALLNKLRNEIPPPWTNETFDAVVFYSALEYIHAHKPRAFYLTFGETDEWGHAGRYDEYLRAARHTDLWMSNLWRFLQSSPHYRDRTTLIIAADHGRGDGPDWRNHNKDVPGAENIWIAAIGPSTPPLGERSNHEPVTQAQIAATLAASLGEDFCASAPHVAPPIPLLVANSP